MLGVKNFFSSHLLHKILTSCIEFTCIYYSSYLKYASGDPKNFFHYKTHMGIGNAKIFSPHIYYIRF